jgi:regulatory protein
MTPRNVAPRPLGQRSNPGPDEAKPPPPVTPAYLERAALHYLERYSASVAMLRQTLKRRVDKRCRLRGEEAGAFAEAIEATVARAVSAGLVDDDRFTAGRLAALRRRGASARALSAKLAAKGVSRDTVSAAMENERATADEGVDLEEAAAQAYAKRRRLGPWRRLEARATYRDRDLAAMARAGFGYALGRRVIEADAPDSEPE